MDERIKVGHPVIVQSIYNNSCNGSYAITKVGRQYFTVDDRIRVNIKTVKHHDPVMGQRYIIWLSQEDKDNEEKAKELQKLIEGKLPKYAGWGFSLSQLERILAIVNEIPGA